jgi:hypothetical protein
MSLKRAKEKAAKDAKNAKRNLPYQQAKAAMQPVNGEMIRDDPTPVAAQENNEDTFLEISTTTGLY